MTDNKAKAILREEFDRVNNKYYEGKYRTRLIIKDWKTTLGKYNRFPENIVIAKRVVEKGGNQLTQTVKHELAHFVVDRKTYGEGCSRGGRWHGKEWKEEMKELDAEPKRLTKGTEHESGYKYVFKCKGCGLTVGRYRKSKFVKFNSSYHCGECGGRFKRIK